MTTEPEAIAQVEAALAALFLPMNIKSGLQEVADRLRKYHSTVEPTAIREVLDHIAAQDAEIARLREALEELMNWQVKNVHVWHNSEYDRAVEALTPTPKAPL